MTYAYPIYVVVPLGDASDPANDEDAATIIRALAPLKTHKVTDPGVCAAITASVLAGLAA